MAEVSEGYTHFPRAPQRAMSSSMSASIRTRNGLGGYVHQMRRLVLVPFGNANSDMQANRDLRKRIGRSMLELRACRAVKPNGVCIINKLKNHGNQCANLK